MKNSVHPRFISVRISALALTLLAMPPIYSATYYWDANDATVGFGTAGGTWAEPTTNNATQGWSTSSAGTNAMSGTTSTTTSDALNFGTGSDGLTAGTITVSGTVAANSLALGSASGAIVLSGGTISLGGTTPTITVSNASNTISSAITGTAGLTKNGTGNLTLSGNNTYSGTTTINAGTLKAGSTTALSSSSAMSVAAGATLDLGGFNNTISSLSTATGTITDSSSAGSGGSLRVLDAMPSTATAQLFAGTMGLQLFGGNTFTSILTNTSNNYSGGTVFGNGTGTTFTRIFGSGTIGSGSPGALTSGIYGTGAITVGASTSDRVQFYLFAATTINNNLVINSEQGNGVGEVGVIRAEAAGIVLAGAINANLADLKLNAMNAAGRTITITGAISGSYGLHVMTASSGGLEVTLNNAGAANSYAGNTTISTANSTLTLGRADQIANGAGKGNLIINSGTFKMGGFNETINGLSGNGTLDGTSGTPTLTVGDNNATTTFTGVIKNTSGTLALTKIGTGTLTLSGNNTYNGGSTVSAGTLEIGAAGRLGGGSYSGNIANSGTFLYSGTNDQVLSGQISGVGGLTKNGSGILTLSGANSYNGTNTLNAGTLKVGSATGLGNGSTVTVSGGVLDLNGFNATVASLGAGSALGTITNAAAGSGTNILTINNFTTNLASLISDGATAKTGLLFNNSSGVPWLSNANNTFSGGITIANGGSSTRMYQLGAVTNTVDGNGTLLKSNFGTGNILIGANGSTAAAQFALTTSNTAIYNGIIFNAASTFGDGGKAAFRVDSSGIKLYGTLTAGASDISFSSGGTGSVTSYGQLTGASGLTLKSGNITLTLSNNSLVTPNDYGGSTTLEASTTLVLGAAEQLSNGAGKGNLTIAGTFNMAGFSETINGLSGNGTIDGISGTPTLTIGDNNASSTFSGVIKNTSGTLALTKIGTGTITLSGNNIYSGATTLSGGTLEIGAAGRLGGGSYSGNIANGGTLLYAGTNSQTLSGEISGVGSLTKNGSSTLTLSGANSYNGTTTLNAGTLRIGSGAALGTSTLVMNSASAVIDSAVGTSYTLSNNITLATNGKIGATTAIGNLTFSGVISGAGNLVVDTLNGVTTLTGLNTFTGNVIVDRAAVDNGLSFNSIADAGVASALGAGSSISVGIGASAPFLTYTGNTAASSNRTISLVGGEAYITSNNAALTLTGNITTSATQTLRLRGTAGGGANLNELSGVYSGGGSLSVQASTGLDVWKISGNNTFTGTTSVINNASLIAGHSNAFGSTANGTQVTTNAQILLTGNISVGAEALILNTGAGGSWNGQTGAALRSYSGNNSWAGTITIGQATTIATNAGAGLTLSGNISGGYNLVFNSIGDTMASGNILTGAGMLSKTGAGILTLAGSNTYSGGTTLTTGTLVMGHANAAGSGTITQSSGSSLLKIDTTGTITNAMSVYNVQASQSATLSGPITANNATWDVDAGDTLTVSGNISGTGGTTKNGTGTLILSGNNSNTGATTVNAGTLTAASTKSLGATSGVVVNNGGSILVTASDAINDSANVTLNGGTLAVDGTFNESVGLLTLSANSVIDLDGYAGTLRFSGVGSWAAGAILSIWNWNGINQYGTPVGDGANNRHVVFTDATGLGSYLDRISFYSASGTGFAGTAFEQGFSGPGGGTEIRVVPEPGTYITAAILLAFSFGLHLMRKRDKANIPLPRG